MQLVLHWGIARVAWYCIGGEKEIYIVAAWNSNFFRLHISSHTKDVFLVIILNVHLNAKSTNIKILWQALSYFSCNVSTKQNDYFHG